MRVEELAPLFHRPLSLVHLPVLQERIDFEPQLAHLHVEVHARRLSGRTTPITALGKHERVRRADQARQFSPGDVRRRLVECLRVAALAPLLA